MSRIFGEIRQNGYVVNDIQQAMHHWSEVLGVGPFFYFESVPLEEFRYRGELSPIEVSIALSNSGPLQIELIQQRNAAPSMYLDFLREGREGLQHVAYWTSSFDADLSALQERGYAIGQSGAIGADGRFVYLETEGHPGTVAELSETGGAKGRFFEHIARVAKAWDGSDPIRPMSRQTPAPASPATGGGAR